MELMLGEGGVELMADCLGLEGGMHFMTYDEATGEPAEELIEGGAALQVTSDNVSEYIELLCEHRLCGRVRFEISQFLAGFYSVVPAGMLAAAGMDELDLALLISGVDELCVDDWREHTTGTALSRCPKLVGWFWEVMEEISAVDRARVLHFTTGCSKLPPDGFRAVGFKIDLLDGVDEKHLPNAHTCFNTIGLPLYRSKEQLRGKLMAAVPYGNAGNWLM
jgi:E3 ubiquitin-protein ligase HUWE1